MIVLDISEYIFTYDIYIYKWFKISHIQSNHNDIYNIIHKWILVVDLNIPPGNCTQNAIRKYINSRDVVNNLDNTFHF